MIEQLGSSTTEGGKERSEKQFPMWDETGRKWQNCLVADSCRVWPLTPYAPSLWIYTPHVITPTCFSKSHVTCICVYAYIHICMFFFFFLVKYMYLMCVDICYTIACNILVDQLCGHFQRVGKEKLLNLITITSDWPI